MTDQAPGKSKGSTRARKSTPRTPGAAPRGRKDAAKLADAPPDKYFWVDRGPTLRNLRELRDALATQISDEQFTHHVHGGENDFARWVDEVLGAPACAAAIRQARTRDEALRAVEGALSARA